MGNHSTKNKGKYLSDSGPKNKTKGKKSRVLILIAVLCAVAVGTVILMQQSADSVYHTVARAGYSGTQEQLLASLVGEELGAPQCKTAYMLACENGYGESEQVWVETITGVCVESVQISPYNLACSNGFQGTFDQWLDSLVSHPEKLGRSKGNASKTEYEWACAYGYEGTFSQWLISISGEQVN